MTVKKSTIIDLQQKCADEHAKATFYHERGSYGAMKFHQGISRILHRIMTQRLIELQSENNA